MFKGDNGHISLFDFFFFKRCLFFQTVKARSFNFGMIITLFGVYIFIVGLMTLTLLQGHMYQKYKLQIVLFRFLLGFFSTVV